MCTVLLPPGVNLIAVNKYISINIKTLSKYCPNGGKPRNQNFKNSCHEYENLVGESLMDVIGKIKR
jgi:hypothetical protein